MSEKEKKSGNILSFIIKVEILKKLFTSKWFYIIIFIGILMSIGAYNYKKAIYIPEDDKVFRIENFSLGKDGGRPFYQTEKDWELTKKLTAVKDKFIFKYLARKYYEIYKNNYSKGRLATQFIEINENQLPLIYKMLEFANEEIQLEKLPKIYVAKSMGTDIMITNYQNPVIILSADFFWAFDENELMFLLARELVHIKCNHIFFLDMIKGLQALFNSALPDFIADFIAGNMGIQLMEWYREAEISADCGGLTVTGDYATAANALMKLNVGVNIEDFFGDDDYKSGFQKLNPNAYIDQIKELENNSVAGASALMHELQNDNPFLTIRVRYLKKWYETNYKHFK